jgi:hypothetical protein
MRIKLDCLSLANQIFVGKARSSPIDWVSVGTSHYMKLDFKKLAMSKHSSLYSPRSQGRRKKVYKIANRSMYNFGNKVHVKKTFFLDNKTVTKKLK